MLQCLWLEAGILEGVNLCISCGSVPKYLQQIMQDNCYLSFELCLESFGLEMDQRPK